MHIGTNIAFNHLTPPEFIRGVGPLLEARGFHSVWVPEHVLFFPEYDSRYPYADSGRIPGDPIGVLEPFTALTVLATTTSRIRLGTGICIVPQRQPVYVARQAADVDYLSGGRLDLGIGIGWLAEEFDALGVPFRERAARTDECVGVMKTLWCDEISEYQGRYYTVGRCHANPKPVQKPHPPLVFGGESDAALGRVARLGDGWYAMNLTIDTLHERLARLDALLAAAGRDRTSVTVHVTPHRSAMNADMFAACREAGVHQLILPLAARTLDRLAERADATLALAAA